MKQSLYLCGILALSLLIACEDDASDNSSSNGTGASAVSIQPTGYDRVGAARFSPDGQLIAMFGEHGDEYALLTVSPDGQEVTEVLASGLDYLSQFSWSPDGSTIYYGGAQGIHRIAADGSGEPELAVEAFAVTGFDVSPDGTHIVWSYNGGTQIFAAEIQEGTVPRAAEFSTELKGKAPRFSPDGSEIVFVSGGDFKTANTSWDGTPWEVSTETGPSGADFFASVAWINDTSYLYLGDDEVKEWTGSESRTLREAFAGMNLDFNASTSRYAFDTNGQPNIMVYSF